MADLSAVPQGQNLLVSSTGTANSLSAVEFNVDSESAFEIAYACTVTSYGGIYVPSAYPHCRPKTSTTRKKCLYFPPLPPLTSSTPDILQNPNVPSPTP